MYGVAVPDPFALAADLFDPPKHPHYTDPVGFSRDYLGFTPWSKQAEVMRAVLQHPRVAVRSSHGVGKTATAARVALWFLATRPNSKVVTTAPTFSQVERLLWPAIRSSVSVARTTDPRMFPEPNKTSLEIADEWFAIGLSTNEPERFQGYHAPYLLLIVDEASGVDEGIYEASEGFTTAEGAHVLLIGNPTRIGGQFHRAFTTERDQWHCIHVSTDHTPNYTGERVSPEVARSLPRKDWAAEKAKQWGVKSAIYQVRVKGNFPTQAADAVMSLADVEDAQARESLVPVPAQLPDVCVSIDVAEYGDDETVIGSRHGARIRLRKAYHGKDLMETVGHGIEVWRTLREDSKADPYFVVDDVGLGGGVRSRLREQGFRVVAFKGSESSYTGKYPNRRSEAWFAFAEALPGLDLDGDEQLLADLTAPTYKLDSQGRRVVEPKGKTKERLGRSPDRADMALMCLAREVEVTVESAGQREQPRSVPSGHPDFETDSSRRRSSVSDLRSEPM